jgi:hypothetical protein
MSRHRPGQILAISLLALLIPACDQKGESEGDRRAQACGEDGSYAYSIVKKYLQAELKAGSQASFPSLSKIRAEKPSNQDPCSWVVYGHVDIETAKGQQLRRRYIASIIYEGDNRWRMGEFELQ